MGSFVGGILVLVCAVAAFNGFMASSQAISVNHQIYAALYYLMSVVAFAGVGIISAINKSISIAKPSVTQKAKQFNSLIVDIKTAEPFITLTVLEKVSIDSLKQLGQEIKAAKDDELHGEKLAQNHKFNELKALFISEANYKNDYNLNNIVSEIQETK